MHEVTGMPDAPLPSPASVGCRLHADPVPNPWGDCLVIVVSQQLSFAQHHEHAGGHSLQRSDLYSCS